MNDNNPDVSSFVATVVAAYVANHKTDASELPQLIRQVHRGFASLHSDAPLDGLDTAKRGPAVPVKKSVTPEYIICLEDGKKLKMLKRHLKTAYNMSPEQYRQRWNLPADYPMVAPTYAKTRSLLAKDIGLGTRKAKAK